MTEITEKQVLDMSRLRNILNADDYVIKDSEGRRIDDPGYVSEWTYTFAAWPSEVDPRWTGAVFTLFRFMPTMVALDMTEEAFTDFRRELVGCGLTLREISRRPYMHEQGVL